MCRSSGRASLCTSFAAYRFLVVRGIVWTQAKNIMLIMSGLYLAPMVYLYIDLVATSLLVWAITQVCMCTCMCTCMCVHVCVYMYV